MAESDKKKTGLSQAERTALNERSKELADEKRGNKKRADGEASVLAAIEQMAAADKELALKIHEIVLRTVPELWPKTWYGMPAYAVEGKQVICFFQAASKFDSRYATFGFNDAAAIDDGNMWAASFGITRITETEEERIVKLLKTAVSK